MAAMRGGDVLRPLRELVDVAEDQGQLFWSLNVTAVLNGSTKSLAAMGEEALRRHLEGRLRPHGPSSWAEALAYEVTRAAPLALLFDLLALDSRLRHHRRALTPQEKAEVVRSVAGEVQRGGETAPSAAPWCGALLREMTACLLDMYNETLRERRGTVEGRDTQRMLQTDAKLGGLLRSGSCREILERLVWLHEQEPGLGDQITLTLAAALPRLNLMRLLVFVRALQEICRDDGSPKGKMRLPTQELPPAFRASLASAVVRAVLTSDLTSMPFEMEEQIQDVRLSPFLSDFERHGLLELMAATPPPSGRSSRSGSVPTRPTSPVRMPRQAAAATKHLPPSPSTRGAELRALRRPAQRLTEPRVQQRPRRPKVNDSYGFGYLPGHPEMEEMEPEPTGPLWRPVSLPPSPREAAHWSQNFYPPESMYGPAPPSPSLQRAASAFQRLAEAASREREGPAPPTAAVTLPRWGF